MAVAFLAGALAALAMAPFNAFPVLAVSFPVAIWLLDGVAFPAPENPSPRFWRSIGSAARLGSIRCPGSSNGTALRRSWPI